MTFDDLKKLVKKHDELLEEQQLLQVFLRQEGKSKVMNNNVAGTIYIDREQIQALLDYNFKRGLEIENTIKYLLGDNFKSDNADKEITNV